MNEEAIKKEITEELLLRRVLKEIEENKKNVHLKVENNEEIHLSFSFKRLGNLNLKLFFAQFDVVANYFGLEYNPKELEINEEELKDYLIGIRFYPPEKN